MNSFDLISAMSYIDDELIFDAIESGGQEPKKVKGVGGGSQGAQTRKTSARRRKN